MYLNVISNSLNASARLKELRNCTPYWFLSFYPPLKSGFVTRVLSVNSLLDTTRYTAPPVFQWLFDLITRILSYSLASELYPIQTMYFFGTLFRLLSLGYPWFTMLIWCHDVITNDQNQSSRKDFHRVLFSLHGKLNTLYSECQPRTGYQRWRDRSKSDRFFGCVKFYSRYYYY